MMENLPQGIIVTTKGKIQFYNKEVENVFNTLGRHSPDLRRQSIYSDESQKLGDENNRAEEENIKILEEELIKKGILMRETNVNPLSEKIDLNGRNLEIKRKLIIFEENDSILHLIQDVTEIKEIENLKAENKFTSVLIAAVTHELRTPTNAILNSMTTLKPLVDNQHLELITVCEQSCEMLIYLIDDIMVYIYIYILLH